MDIARELPVVQGFYHAQSRAEPVCPYAIASETESSAKWWMGYVEGVVCFGGPIKPIPVPSGHDHPEWV